MSNEEIRKQVKPLMNVLGGYMYNVNEMDAIQDLTRKDERERVYKELFDYVFNYENIDLSVMNDILAQINLLRESK